MATAPRFPRTAAVLILASFITGCGIGPPGTTTNPDRFHGAADIHIPRGQSEPSWWIDPSIAHYSENPPAEPQVVEVTVPSDTLFDIGSSEITPSAEAALDIVHASLNGGVAREVTLHCHADSTGNPDANQRLSDQRADSLGSWISIHWDVPGRQIAVYGHGDTQPIASNELPTGRAQNRRCEITFMVERRL